MTRSVIEQMAIAMSFETDFDFFLCSSSDWDCETLASEEAGTADDPALSEMGSAKAAVIYR